MDRVAKEETDRNNLAARRSGERAAAVVKNKRMGCVTQQERMSCSKAARIQKRSKHCTHTYTKLIRKAKSDGRCVRLVVTHIC